MQWDLPAVPWSQHNTGQPPPRSGWWVHVILLRSYLLFSHDLRHRDSAELRPLLAAVVQLERDGGVEGN